MGRVSRAGKMEEEDLNSQRHPLPPPSVDDLVPYDAFET